MSDAQLWLALVLNWRSHGMGNTGPTLPFLIGATRIVGIRDGIPTISDFGSLLFSFQTSKSHYIRIEACARLGQPVVGSYDRSSTMDGSELIRRNKGSSSLYIGNRYRHGQGLESAIEALWSMVEPAVTNGMFSFNGSRYGEYLQRELNFIRAVASSCCEGTASRSQ